MNNVERAVAESFARWRIETGRNESSEHKISEDMADYMMEAFQINSKSSEVANILDLLNTFVASDVEETVSQNGVRDNAIHCAENDIKCVENHYCTTKLLYSGISQLYQE